MVGFAITLARRAYLMALVSLFVTALIPVSAGAVTGTLTPQGCVSDFNSAAPCAAQQQGLAGAYAVAVSPDGKSVYATGLNDDAIVRFDRASASGTLTAQGCVADTGDPAGCGVVAAGLADPTAIAVSPDGKSVYVASAGSSDAVARFDRDTATGALTAKGCISDTETAAAGCATTQGLANADGVAVSPDSKSVYVVSDGDGAIVRFDRDLVLDPGALTPADCLSDIGSGACPTHQQGLGGATAVTVTSDGKSVYVVSNGDSAIARFDRDAGGALAAQGCIADLNDVAGCGGPTQQGLGQAQAVAATADGRSVYVASRADDAVARFDRDAAGALTPQGCIADVGTSICAATQQGLNGAFGVAATGDNTSVYATGQDDHAIVRFDRDSATGALTGQGCIAGTGDSAGCGATAQSLVVARGVAASADNVSIYLAAFGQNAILRFDRGDGSVQPPPVEPPPVTPPPVAPPPSGTDELLVGRPIGLYLPFQVRLPGKVTVKDASQVAKADLTAAKKRLLKPTSKRLRAAGKYRVKLRLTARAKRIWKMKGSLKVRAAITFRPDGGTPGTLVKRLKLSRGR